MGIEPDLNELPLLFAKAQRLLLSRQKASLGVEAIASVVKDAVPGALGSGVSLMDSRGRRTSTAATDDVVTTIDELQYELGEGPCLTAWAASRIVRIDDLAAEERWPQWAAAVAGMPVRSVISAPLKYEQQTLGALKVYSATAHAFGPGHGQLLESLSVPAAVLLANMQSDEAPRRLSDQLTTALTSRGSVNYAAGMLMERHGIGTEEAMDLLLSTARDNGVSVHAAAQTILSAPEDHTR